MYTAICDGCSNPTKVPFIPDSTRPAYCPDCLAMIHRGELPNIVKDQVPSKIKSNQYSISVQAEIKEEGAILSALIANADAFRAFGGSPLMLTEHIENGCDAIKVKANWREGDTRTHIGKIEIIIDQKNYRIIVIDNGTGIEDPLWILGHPLHSRKSGLKYQVGKYGRGLQGFRGFCKTLEYITFRDKPNPSEEIKYQEAMSVGQLSPGFDTRCVKLSLVDTSIHGTCTPVNISEFRKFTNNKTGTVAIFSDWHDNDFEELVRRKKELFNRIQHHFRDVLENELIEITITQNNKTETIPVREFVNDNGEFDLYDIEDMDVVNPTMGEHVGKIEFFLYKVTGEYKDDYKKPFLLAKDNRPLQNSFLSEMPEFSEDPIWKSPYVTGYIKCNFVEPNQLRIALVPGEKKRLFVEHVRAAAIDLRKLVTEYQNGFLKEERTAENQNIILEIQSFLKKNKIKLNLPDLSKLGSLTDGMGDGINSGDRISSKPGKENQGLITPQGSVETVILYEKDKHGEKKKKSKKRIKVKIKTRREPTKDGSNEKTVYIDPNLLSKDGRRRKTVQVGINLETIQEELNEDMSNYDEFSKTVYVNELHPLFKEMERIKKNSSEKNSVYSKKEKNYIRRCYLWELIKNLYKEEIEGEKENKFWYLYHKFFLYKESD